LFPPRRRPGSGYPKWVSARHCALRQRRLDVDSTPTRLEPASSPEATGGIYTWTRSQSPRVTRLPPSSLNTPGGNSSTATFFRRVSVPDLPLFATNTAAFIHNMDEAAISNVAGDSNYVRVQVLTPVGVLDRDKQLGVVNELTDIVAAAARDPSLRERTWVLLTESPEGGWGIGGHANTNADIAAAARAALEGQ
jgi:phenylpyruvate tautomerase PptA (4-oxalocrotonate tautomerase family)